eukprot:SAG11_NODE_225_length_12064_cov_7.850815_7_plen_183_part_00
MQDHETPPLYTNVYGDDHDTEWRTDISVGGLCRDSEGRLLDLTEADCYQTEGAIWEKDGTRVALSSSGCVCKGLWLDSNGTVVHGCDTQSAHCEVNLPCAGALNNSQVGGISQNPDSYLDTCEAASIIKDGCRCNVSSGFGAPNLSRSAKLRSNAALCAHSSASSAPPRKRARRPRPQIRLV